MCHTSYPIAHTLLITNYQIITNTLSCNFSSVYELQFYHLAAKLFEWCKVVSEEIAALEANNTWIVQPLPHNKKTIGCRWIYKMKYKADRALDRYKACLVTIGYTQQPGLDFLDMFSLVVKLNNVRVLLSLAAIHNWKLAILDINDAFLKGDLSEEIYMDLPLGYPRGAHDM